MKEYNQPSRQYDLSKLSSFQNKILTEVRENVNDKVFVNSLGEIIVSIKDNLWFRLLPCNSMIDIQRKIICFLSRPACSHTWYAPTSRAIARKMFKRFIGKKFTDEEYNLIYTYLGNGCNESVTEKFIKSKFDMQVIKDHDAVAKKKWEDARQFERDFPITPEEERTHPIFDPAVDVHPLDEECIGPDTNDPSQFPASGEDLQ